LGSVWSTMHDVEDEQARNRHQSYDLDNEYMDA
jgi:hypothetical protein